MIESAIVLCGGRSSRMGRDKAALPFGPETLLTRVVRLVQAVADDVVVVGHTAESMPDGVRVVRDPLEGLGPLAGLATGLGAVRGHRALLLACDMPLLVPALLQRLLALAGDADACVPLLDDVPMTTCAVYTARALPRAQAYLAGGTRSLRALLEGVPVRWVLADELRDVDPNLLSFRDCDSPEGYEAALTLAGFGPTGSS